MRLLCATATAALALGATACSPVAGYKPVTRLDCPATQGDLTRVSQAADGKSCGYTSEDGAEVTLKLIPVSGGVDATLKGVESELRAQLGQDEPAEAGAASASEPETKATPAETAPSGATASDAAAARAQAEADVRAPGAAPASSSEAADEKSASTEGDDWGVAQSDGAKTRVDLPGVHIVADDADDSAEVHIGPLHINANENGAVVRMQHDVRLRGEAMSREKRGVRATFILADKNLPGGYNYAGYEAGGPRSGPLTVAIVKGRGHGDHDDIYEAIKKLVRRNGGV